MAEHKLVPPAEQWHEVTILISKRQDDLLQQHYPPPRQLVETVWEAWCGQPGVNVWWR
jgi:hypothetical protein